MTIGVALIAVLSAIGVCERCHMERGGVYFLLSHVLGARIGATIGILYCFGQVKYYLLYSLRLYSYLKTCLPWPQPSVKT